MRVVAWDAVPTNQAISGQQMPSEHAVRVQSSKALKQIFSCSAKQNVVVT